MDNFRRPSSVGQQKQPTVDGLLPANKNTADQNSQPFRAAKIAQAEAPRPRRRVALDMSLPEGESPNRHHMGPVIKSRVGAKTLAFRSVLVSMALLIGVGGLLLSQGYLNLRKVFKGGAVSAASLQEDVNPNLLKGEGDGRINVLLVGVGGKNHDGGELTDTLMLASIDPVNHTASLRSVPRDLWVTIPGKGSMKINAAYAAAKQSYVRKNGGKASSPEAITAGFTGINQTMERVLGVPINYNLMVDFQAFKKAVDTVGGITVNVPEDLYDPTMAWENNRNPYLARAGTQTFNGKQALMYVRSRETSSDFARGERQRATLLALKQKTVTAGVIANPTKLSKLMGAFGDNVQTDFSMGDASRMYSIIKKVSNKNFQSVSLAGTTSTTSAGAGTDSVITTGTINGQSIVMPKAGLENYGGIQDFVRSRLQDGYIVKEKAKVKIINGTVSDGFAKRVADKLRGYGYNVVGVDSTKDKVFADTTIVNLSGAKHKYTKRYLEQRFTTKAVTALPDTTITPGNADFVVVLGGDETGTY